MNSNLKKELQHLEGIKVSWNVPLAGHISLRVGGPVSCLLEPYDVAGLQTALQVLNNYHYPYFVLGRGTNLLVSDAGIKAVAISLERGFSHLRSLDSTGRVAAGAGLRLTRLLRYCLQHGLSGFEFIAGIPGSVGGAMRMNAGTHVGAMADVCKSARVLQSDGSLIQLSGTQLRFSYRKFELAPGAVLLEAHFSFVHGSRDQIRRKVRSLLKERKLKQPWHVPSAGSVFKNPAGDFAGRLIEAVGLKGARIGDAQISPQHANFIVNRGQAKTSDILALIGMAKEKVAQSFGIQLELEIELIGNDVDMRSEERPRPCTIFQKDYFKDTRR